MIGVYALRTSVAFISCAQATNALRMISVVIGSGGGAVVAAMPAAFVVERSAGARPSSRAAPSRAARPSWSSLLDARGRAARSSPGRQAIAAQYERRRVRRAGEDGRATRARAQGVALRLGARNGPGRRRAAERGDAEVHDLDPLARVRVAVADVVRVVERRGEPRSDRRRRRSGTSRVLLADVAQVGRASDVAVSRDRRRRLASARRASALAAPGRAPAEGLGRSSAPRSRKNVWTKSWRTSVCSMPQAENVPGLQGTITSAISSSSASHAACIGPAPPKATRAKSRGSMPRATVIVGSRRPSARSRSRGSPRRARVRRARVCPATGRRLARPRLVEPTSAPPRK